MFDQSFMCVYPIRIKQLILNYVMVLPESITHMIMLSYLFSGVSFFLPLEETNSLHFNTIYFERTFKKM